MNNYWQATGHKTDTGPAEHSKLNVVWSTAEQFAYFSRRATKPCCSPGLVYRESFRDEECAIHPEIGGECASFIDDGQYRADPQLFASFFACCQHLVQGER